MRKAKVRRIYDYSYFRVIFLVSGPEQAIVKWLADFNSEIKWKTGRNGNHGMYICADSAHYVVIATDKGGKTKRTEKWRLSALAHEVMHLVFSVFDSAGIGLHSTSEEAFTYYFQSIYFRMLDAL